MAPTAVAGESHGLGKQLVGGGIAPPLEGADGLSDERRGQRTVRIRSGGDAAGYLSYSCSVYVLFLFDSFEMAVSTLKLACRSHAVRLNNECTEHYRYAPLNI